MFSIYLLTSGFKLYIHLLNVVVRFIVFLNSTNLICRGTDISKYSRESFGLDEVDSPVQTENMLITWTCIRIYQGKISLITTTRLFECIESVTTKNCKFSDKNFDIFYISAHNRFWYSLAPPRRGSSNEYPQSMFLSRNQINNVYTCKPQFYYINMGFKGIKIV